MPYPSRKFVLGQAGFTLGAGTGFEDRDCAVRIYDALLGEHTDNMPKAEMWQRAGETLTIFFRAIIEQSVLFKALRGSDIVWEMIVTRANLLDDLSIGDAQTLAEKMAACRNRDFTSTELARLVDQYVALRNSTAALGPPITFQLALRGHSDSSGSGSGATGADVNDLTATLGSLSVSNWPPPQFVVGDLAVLADPTSEKPCRAKPLWLSLAPRAYLWM